jgi:glucose dehydrogenase
LPELQLGQRRSAIAAALGPTIYDQLICRVMFHKLRYEGRFTPPSLQVTLVFPGNLDIFEWSGIALTQIVSSPSRIPSRYLSFRA